MMNGKRIAAAVLLTGAAWGLGLPAASAQEAEPSADELSSVKWRDCAGHFFFLAKMTGNSEQQKDMTNKLKSWGILAVYASETKAKAEAKAGDTSDGRGKSMADAETGKLKVDVETMIGSHAEMAKKQGQNAYVKAYSEQCAKPIQAYAKRFMKKAEAHRKNAQPDEQPKQQ